MNERTKAEIIRLLNTVNRPGIDKLIDFLKTSDFFTAPASTSHHLACVGGLAQHSYNVFEIMLAKNKQFAGSVDISEESIIVAALGHDFCKMGYYKEGGEPCSNAQFKFLDRLVSNCPPGFLSEEFCERFFSSTGALIRDIPKEQATILIDWLKNGAQGAMPDLPMTWSVDDQLPLGHGEKSLSILQDHIKLTDEEKSAIRWHMGFSDAGTHFFYPTGAAFRAAKEKWPLVTLLACADDEAAFILEREEVKFEGDVPF